MSTKKYVRAAAVLFAVLAALTLLFGCGKDETPESQTDAQIMEQQGVPDIFIEESQQLGDQDTPPTLVVETTDGENVTATYATLGGYVWEWLDSAGKVRLSEEEAPCAADMREIAVVERKNSDGSAILRITGGTLRSVQVWKDGAVTEDGEKITIENDTIVFPESGAHRYEIVVEYAGGRVYYAFMVTE